MNTTSNMTMTSNKKKTHLDQTKQTKPPKPNQSNQIETTKISKFHFALSLAQLSPSVLRN